MDITTILHWVDELRLHRSSKAGTALKKPLLLLLLLSKIDNDERVKNVFKYSEVEKELDLLIRNFGNRTSGAKPYQPFHHLNSSPIWDLHLPVGVELTSGKTANVSLLRQESVYGFLNEEAFHLLKHDERSRTILINYILEKFWPQTIQDELRSYFNFSFYNPYKQLKRDPKFAPKVLANFRYKCAMCGFQAHFNQIPFGLDAAHILWHSFEGPSTVENGLSLCKLHHWAFDKGVLTVLPDKKIKVSKHFVGSENKSQKYIEDLDGITLLDWKEVEPSKDFFSWHNENIFIQ
ncbi:putative restriction endonuclease [Bacillus ectoiniformans]|uniref:phosphorothioated DNA-binding restriction endonuclease n=1 Tax=Bacillus ectoiniformans TaxID=1494429 RepID=UPI001956AFC9|nr:HNH endonuclease [Bacillus ectoiniformans]MBM7648651.1 putative restriction endonuclease [Bacillus ectoiniformans]